MNHNPIITINQVDQFKSLIDDFMVGAVTVENVSTFVGFENNKIIFYL